MTFQQLQYFLEVERTGSVTKAAKNLFVSYPSVSVAITNMEKELGVILFTRDAKGLALTEQGERVLEYANSISRAYAMMNNVRQEGRRTVRFNGGDYPTIGKAFARLAEENLGRTDIELMMTTCDTEDSFRKLVNGDLALGIMMFLDHPHANGERRLKREGLKWERLKQIPVSICVGKGHPLYDAQTIDFRQTRDHTLIIPNAKAATRGYLYRQLCADAEKIVRVSTLNARREMVIRGLGYSVEALPPADRQDAQLRYIPIEGIYYNMVAAGNPQMPVQPEAVRFLEILKEQLKEDY